MAKDVLAEMESCVDDLIENASALKQMSTGTVESEGLAKLQEAQEQLIAELVKIDRKVSKEGLANDDSPVWQRIQKKLDAFAELNEAFIQNLAVRKGLIQFELQDIKKSRKALVEMKERYGGSGDDKTRINKVT